MYNLGKDLSVLALSMTVNIMLGTYNQIGRKNCRFSRKRFLSGLIKAVIVGLSLSLIHIFTWGPTVPS